MNIIVKSLMGLMLLIGVACSPSRESEENGFKCKENCEATSGSENGESLDTNRSNGLPNCAGKNNVLCAKESFVATLDRSKSLPLGGTANASFGLASSAESSYLAEILNSYSKEEIEPLYAFNREILENNTKVLDILELPKLSPDHLRKICQLSTSSLSKISGIDRSFNKVIGELRSVYNVFIYANELAGKLFCEK